MPVAAKEETREKILRRAGDQRKVSKKQTLKPQLLSKKKVANCFIKDEGSLSLKKRKKIVERSISRTTKTHKKHPSSGVIKDKNARTSKQSEKLDDKDAESPKLKRRRRRKKKKKNEELDEASRLQRRTRYLLIKMKLEQNFIDAYSAEGWKGQSREKIRPDRELQKSKKQILKCKLGIREAIRQLDLLSSEGHINDSAVAPDGSVHHEHIICAKCKLRDAYPDNDIILCDGTCNCAFHQKCLDPPLLTENIPPGDEGWLCKFCKKKVEILEATNAHLGTQFPTDSNWQDVFKEEAALPDGENSLLCAEEEWPSDDSEDGDYDPVEQNCSGSISLSESDASNCSSSFVGSLEDETLLGHGRISFDNSHEITGVDSDKFNGDVISRPRQRASVDYIKLHDEMFGKNAIDNEQISDDEDWGPTRRKRKVKGVDAPSTPMTIVETNINLSEKNLLEPKQKLSSRKAKRPIFRLPHNAVEKLRLAFAENELPERALRKSLSEQLGLDFDKVNKWFKNARYLALKARKAGGGANASPDISPSVQMESTSKNEKSECAEQMVSMDNKSLSKYVRRGKAHLLSKSLKMKQRKKLSVVQPPRSSKTTLDFGDDVSLKHLKEKAKVAKKKKISNKGKNKPEAEAELERLLQIKNNIEKLRNVLLQLPSSRFGKTNLNNSSTVYVPVAELKEKG